MNLLFLQDHRGETYPLLESFSHPTKKGGARSGKWSQIKENIRLTYQRFRERFDYREQLCASLRHVSDLQIHHSSTLGPDTAKEKFRDFLKIRYRKHSLWLWIDGFLALVGVFFMPLPGPNIFFFYPAARAMGHYFARKGAEKAVNLEKLSFRADPLIDQIERSLGHLETVKNTIVQLENLYNVHNLESHLTRLKNL